MSVKRNLLRALVQIKWAFSGIVLREQTEAKVLGIGSSMATKIQQGYLLLMERQESLISFDPLD